MFQKDIVGHEFTEQMEEPWANVWKWRSKNSGLQDAAIGIRAIARTTTDKKYEILKQDYDWKKRDHMLMCTSEVCATEERVHVTSVAIHGKHQDLTLCECFSPLLHK